jgi:hypothetical protein
MSIRTEVIQQTESQGIDDDIWQRQTNGNVINDASYMGINFISNGNNHMMIAGSMNPINTMSNDQIYDIAEQGLAIRVAIPECKVVAHILETDDIGASKLVRVDYSDANDTVVMQILLRKVETDDEKNLSVGINVNVIDDSSMYGNNVVYNENGQENVRMSLSDMDGKETLITGRRVPRNMKHKLPKKTNNTVIFILIAIFAILFGVIVIKNRK